ncbi:MFS transporter [Catenulispora subtropica]|uniref:Major facilitator superfamily MFS_1 n=1 Tax=Catenulispora subtropica TaxID=450798 RepID=A0ABN2RU45_9ACTN
MASSTTELPADGVPAGQTPRRRGRLALLASLFLVDLGAAMVAIALPLLLVREYGVSFAVGLTFAIGVLPRIVAAPLLGNLLIRYDPRRIAIVGALGSAPLTALIPVTDRMWQFQLLNLAVNIFGAVAEPSRLALRAATIEAGEEFRGNGLFIAAERVPRVLGPGLVGILTGLGVGPDWSFSFPTAFAVAAALLVLRVPAAKRPDRADAERRGFLATTVGNLRLLVTTASGDRFVAALTLTAFPYVAASSIARIMLLTMAQTRFAGHPGLFGWLLGAISLGAVLGALLSGRVSRIDYGTLYIAGNLIEAAVWLGLTTVHNPYVALVAVFLTGILEAAPTVVFFAEVQRRLRPELLGYFYAAVMPLIDAALTGGYLLGGALIHHGVTLSGWCVAVLIAVPVLATVRWYRVPPPALSASI